MIQRLIILFILFAPLAHAAEIKHSEPATIKQQRNLQQSAEDIYLNGLGKLKLNDLDGASSLSARISPASPYSSLLQAQIAAARHDFETVMSLLLPMEGETRLLPQAYVSLHSTLALAYESQLNLIKALEQWVKADPLLDSQSLTDNQSHIWQLLSKQTREILVEMRGKSSDYVVQGWIDLALVLVDSEQKEHSVKLWRSAYPDHPVTTALLEQIALSLDKAPAPTLAPSPANKKIALLLPLDNLVYAGAAKVVLAGIMAAQTNDATNPEVVTYSTNGAENVVSRYWQAVEEGASDVIGPLTRDAVVKLAAENLTVPVLTLNQPDQEIKSTPKLTLFGLSVEAEAQQVAHIARRQGIQSALIVNGETPLAMRMAKAFADEWRAENGTLVAQISLPEPEKRAEFKDRIAQENTDMIFLAADVAQAQTIRPWLNMAIPTYGTSHLYNGVRNSIQNNDLLAVHFVDAPWLVDPDRPEYANLRPVETMSANLQRFYALGLDALRLVTALANKPEAGQLLLNGATGNIIMQQNGTLSRELTPAQFHRDGVFPESIQ